MVKDEYVWEPIEEEVGYNYSSNETRRLQADSTPLNRSVRYSITNLPPDVPLDYIKLIKKP